MSQKMGEILKAKGFEVETDVREWVKQQLEANAGTSGSSATTAAPAPAPAPAPAQSSPSSSFDVATIVGSMTFDEAAKATGIPASAWIAKWGITQGQMGEKLGPTVKAKGLDVETDVREWVKQQLEAGAAK